MIDEEINKNQNKILDNFTQLIKDKFFFSKWENAKDTIKPRFG